VVNFIQEEEMKSLAQRLVSECLAAAKEEGAAVKKEWILTRWQKLTKHSHFRF
jgi:small subunit ribosomal protein S7